MFALCWLLVPLLTFLALSPPLLLGRYVLFIVPAIAVLAGAGIDRAISSWRAPVPLRLLAATVVVIGTLRGPIGWLVDGDVEDWRSAANLLFLEGEPDDAALFSNDTTRLFFEYYRHRAGDPAPPRSFWPNDPWGEYETGDEVYRAPPPSTVIAAAERRRRSSWSWASTTRGEQSSPKRRTRCCSRTLGPRW